MARIEESTIFRAFTAFAIFILLTFNRDLGVIYIAIMFSDWVWWNTDTKVSFPFQKRGDNTKEAFVKGLAAYFLFLLISTVVLSTGGASTGTDFQSIIHLLSTGTPALKGSAILTILGWGLMVPIVETRFFHGRLQEGIAEIIDRRTPESVNMRDYKPLNILVMLIVAALFTLFHLTAKNMETLPLMVTFIFSLVSSVLVVHDQETESAVYLHMITNTVSVVAGLGLL